MLGADRNRRIAPRKALLLRLSTRKSIARPQAIGDKLDGMTYIPPPLNALRAFEAAARHLSFKWPRMSCM
jgi:hypothetical protein